MMNWKPLLVVRALVASVIEIKREIFIKVDFQTALQPLKKEVGVVQMMLALLMQFVIGK